MKLYVVKNIRAAGTKKCGGAGYFLAMPVINIQKQRLFIAAALVISQINAIFVPAKDDINMKHTLQHLITMGLAATLWALVLAPTPAAAQTRRALVIGIGQYKDTSWGRINGDKDVAVARTMLTRAGYRDIRTLVNAEATKSAICAAFRRLARDCKRGDIVYVHFSGHGQQMTDLDGDERDGWDECWVPYDACRTYCAADRGEKHLTDDETNDLLAAVSHKVGPAGRLLVVADACHSGDSSRDEGSDEVVRGVGDKFVLPGKKRAKARPGAETWITLSACKDYQRNAELRTKDGRVGKLTYALSRLLGTDGVASNRDLYARLCDFFNRNRGSLQQTPVLSGAAASYRITDILR